MTYAVVAAAAVQAQQAEEESMTPYSPADLAENWEFKIVRSATGKFRDPQFLRSILQEEAQAGWTLVEKFDNSRVRLKRPASERANDSLRALDPYRIAVGPGTGVVVAVSVAASLALVAVIIGFLFLIIGPPHGR
jgi:hypothetical protein